MDETDLARDMKEEYRRILVELGLTNISNIGYKTRYQLMLTKRKLAILLVGKVGLVSSFECRNVKLRMDWSNFPLQV